MCAIVLAWLWHCRLPSDSTASAQTVRLISFHLHIIIWGFKSLSPGFKQCKSFWLCCHCCHLPTKYPRSLTDCQISQPQIVSKYQTRLAGESSSLGRKNTECCNIKSNQIWCRGIWYIRSKSIYMSLISQKCFAATMRSVYVTWAFSGLQTVWELRV